MAIMNVLAELHQEHDLKVTDCCSYVVAKPQATIGNTIHLNHSEKQLNSVWFGNGCKALTLTTSSYNKNMIPQ